ncbi:MAG: SpoIIE family protein phosphatase [Flavobacteriaceae bacterium]|nr:SpoIIE family protein phosphatase [Flavobacteriaceae bacterium]
MRSILFTIFFLSFVNTFYGQAHKFESFLDKNRLDQRFVYTLIQDEQGYLIVGTGDGAFRYDGKHFEPIETQKQENMLGKYITSSAIGSDGTAYFGHFEGGVSSFKGSEINYFDFRAIAPSKVVSLEFDSEDRLWALTQMHGLVRIDKDGSFTQFTRELDTSVNFEFFISSNDECFVGSDQGLLFFLLNDGEPTNYQQISDFEGLSVSALCSIPEEEAYLVGTDEFGVFWLQNVHEKWEVKSQGEDFDSESVKHIMATGEDEFWISTNSGGLLKTTIDQNKQLHLHYSFKNLELHGARSIEMTFVDREGNLWVATNGEGLQKMSDDFFSFYTVETEEGAVNIKDIISDESGLWLATDKEIVHTGFRPTDINQVYGEDHGLPVDEYRCLMKDMSGTLWVGSSNSGLFYKRVEDEVFKAFDLTADKLNRRINDILEVGTYLYVATDFGIYQIKQDRVIAHLSIQSGLPHNVINALHLDRKGRIWIGANKQRITYIENGMIKSMLSQDRGLLGVDLVGFDQGYDQGVWIASNGFGVLYVSDTDTLSFKKENGLFSDYCYSIKVDSKGNAWVGHRGGLSKIHGDLTRVDSFDHTQLGELDFTNKALTRDKYNMLWFAAGSELLRYDPLNDVPNKIAPKVLISSMQAGDSLFIAEKSLFLPYDEYKIEFNFQGLSLKNPEAVTYSYMLEGHDLDWSEPSSSNKAIYPRLYPGEYTFKLKAFNEDGVESETTGEIELKIAGPFWMKWWFILGVSVLIFLAVLFTVKKREEIMVENQLKLEKALDLATKELVDQKELVEIKNKDITDSIIYAKSIQKAMLPHPNELQKFFNQAFVFYKPRDIVSGDFYWVDQFENKIVVACADCTGHGVPGAFMSLISSTLLDAQANIREVDSPKELLEKVDEKLTSLLFRGDADFAVNDGMDISVTEFDLKTRTLRYSGAGRPLVLIRNGEMEVINGDRFALGGDERVKEFTLHTIQLEKGDSFYQFSDGFPDQFGGPNGKKLKKKGILELIQHMQGKDMSVQLQETKRFFAEWKGKYEQVDDIIFVGITV